MDLQKSDKRWYDSPVNLTNYSGDEEADRVAEIMADGFVWRD